MLAMGPRDLNSAPYSPVHCSSHSMTSFQSSELTELPVVENSQLFAQRAHSARYAPSIGCLSAPWTFGSACRAGGGVEHWGAEHWGEGRGRVSALGGGGRLGKAHHEQHQGHWQRREERQARRLRYAPPHLRRCVGSGRDALGGTPPPSRAPSLRPATAPPNAKGQLQ